MKETNEVRDGSSVAKAIIMGGGSSASGSRAIYDMVGKMLGSNDDDYFILSEQTLEDKKTNKNYRILFVEDNQGRKLRLYFDISEWTTIVK